MRRGKEGRSEEGKEAREEVRKERREEALKSMAVPVCHLLSTHSVHLHWHQESVQLRACEVHWVSRVERGNCEW